MSISSAQVLVANQVLTLRAKHEVVLEVTAQVLMGHAITHPLFDFD